MRVRSPWYVLSGALGGCLGFAIMELARAWVLGGSFEDSHVAGVALYFGGFGLAVGAALGSTEGLVRRQRAKAVYGLVLGLVLGAIGGGIGGAAGQAIYGLVPVRYQGSSEVDVVIALDSSGSMRRFLLWGSDPFGRRKTAAKRLIDRLSPQDRVAVVDFDHQARLLHPLDYVDTPARKRAAKRAVGRIDCSGGTDLDAGLTVAIRELVRTETAQRPRHIIFLTDGVGKYSPATARMAQRHGIVVHTIGLGDGVQASLLQQIAQTTGGAYYPVESAAALVATFEKIFTDHLVMTERAETRQEDQGEPITSPALLYIARILSWGVMGLVIGAGQGVRENTREDLKACSLGGLIGGLAGGALFNPLCSLAGPGSAAVGRGLADLVVGACIGGAMRLIQEQVVDTHAAQATTLLRVLPQNERALRVRTGTSQIRGDAG